MANKIIIIDDEIKLAENFALLLRMHGYEAEAFARAYDAIRYVQENPGACDVAVCDIRMPGIKGDRLCSELKKTDIYLQCIVMTGFPDQEVIEKLLKLGITDIFTKPLDGEVLLNTVRVACERNRRLKEMADNQ